MLIFIQAQEGSKGVASSKMSVYFEIAYAAVSERLCLLTGTGFSKAITLNEAPSWQDLLIMCCRRLPNKADLRKSLFPKDEKNPLPLEESAQIINIELSKNGMNIYNEIAELINSVVLDGDNSIIQNFLVDTSLHVITTNYDKLIEQLIGKDKCHSIAPGMPIPRSEAHIDVYHIHGSVDSPLNMVVTSDDYYKFINIDSYFSRKISTIMHENTVVILGYSLGDTNLKAILSDYKVFSRTQAVGGNIFLVSKNGINQYIKDYYANCYGIRVLDELEIHEFIKKVNKALPKAKDCFEKSLENIRNVLFKKFIFTDEYLKIESSFSEIISSLAALGKSVNDADVVKMLGDIISKKRSFTNESGAWDQYEQLAKWLIYLGSLLDLENTPILEIYLDAVRYSMSTMSKSLTNGYSWYAYSYWYQGWFNITPSNRRLIKDYIVAKTHSKDALDIVNK